MKIVYILLFSWFLVGLLSFLHFLVHDLRGEEYDPDYFDSDLLMMFLVSVLLGYLTTLLILYDRQVIQRILYKLANIGYKERE